MSEVPITPATQENSESVIAEFNRMSVVAANTVGAAKLLEKSYQDLLSRCSQAIATYHVNPSYQNELATIMCEFLEGKRT